MCKQTAVVPPRGSALRFFAQQAKLLSTDGSCKHVFLKAAVAGALVLAVLSVALIGTSLNLTRGGELAKSGLAGLAEVVPTPVLGLLAVGGLLSLLFQPLNTGLSTRATFAGGFLFMANWLVFWAPPIVIQGALFKLVLIDYLRPIYDLIDKSPSARAWAAKHIYEKPQHADFFATQLFFLIGAGASLGLVFYWQVSYGSLPWWLLIGYYYAWIGVGGRGMGAAYSISHKEGHFNLYQPWIKNSVGNFFENWVGLFYGGVPWNFTTTHISIHHRLDAGRGDTLYNWDYPRCCIPNLMLYLVRGLVHCSGFGGLIQFGLSPRKRDNTVCFRKLAKGCLIYWVAAPAVCLYLFDLSFYFWIIVQPLLCMTFFLSIINHGFHGFIEFDKEQKHNGNVTSTTMVGSYDDYFGEDDHMAHHHHVGVYYRELPNHQRKQCEQWAVEKASVFQGLDVFTFAVWVVLKAWPLLARRYMDFSGKMTEQEIAEMLEIRCKRRDSEYSGLLPAIPWGQKWQSCVESYEDKGPLSLMCPAFDEACTNLQLWVCSKMEEGLPPMRSFDELGFPGYDQIQTRESQRGLKKPDQPKLST